MSTELLNDQSQTENTIHSISGVTLDGNRVRAVLDLAESNINTNLILVLTDAEGKEVARSLIMGIMNNHIEFTLHIRLPEPAQPLILKGITYINESQPIDTKICLISLIS